MEKQNKEKYGCKKLFFENGFWNRCNGVDKCSECKQSGERKKHGETNVKI